MGQSKISLKELANMKRKFVESIDGSINRFRLLKSRCFTQLPEHELVKMDRGLEPFHQGEIRYSIPKGYDPVSR